MAPPAAAAAAAALVPPQVGQMISVIVAAAVAFVACAAVPTAGRCIECRRRIKGEACCPKADVVVFVVVALRHSQGVVVDDVLLLFGNIDNRFLSFSPLAPMIILLLLPYRYEFRNGGLTSIVSGLN